MNQENVFALHAVARYAESIWIKRVTMEYLYAPWRGTYTGKGGQEKPKCSPFSNIFDANKDADYFILTRLTHHGIILNQYPYNPGHLLIVPYQEVSSLAALSAQARYELMEATTQSINVLQKTINNPGTNVGLNLGDTASGGSILNHIHMHIIPRWHGDTSFLPLVAETKVLSQDLKTVYDTLRPAFEELHIPLPEL